MFLLFFLFVNNIIFFNHLIPPAIRLVSLLRSMSTAASWKIMFHLNSLLSLFEGFLDFFPTKNIPIEMLTKNLCCLIFNGVFRINHNNIVNTHLKELLSDCLRITRIDEDYIWQLHLDCSQDLDDLFRLDNL